MATWYWTGQFSDDVEDVTNYDSQEAEPWMDPPSVVPGAGDEVIISGSYFSGPGTGDTYATWFGQFGSIVSGLTSFYGSVTGFDFVYGADFYGNVQIDTGVSGYVNFYDPFGGGNVVQVGQYLDTTGVIGPGVIASCGDFQAGLVHGSLVTQYMNPYNAVQVYPSGSLDVLSDSMINSNVLVEGRIRFGETNWLYGPNSIWTAALGDVKSGTTNINGTGTLVSAALLEPTLVKAGADRGDGTPGTAFALRRLRNRLG